MTPQADQYTINDIKGMADIVEEIDLLTTICGFIQPGVMGTDAERKAMPVWSMLKITKSATTFPRTTTMQWAGGLCSFNKIWNNRSEEQYFIKRF